MATLHHAMHKLFKEIELEATHDCIERLKSNIAPAEYTKLCIEAIQEWKNSEDMIENIENVTKGRPITLDEEKYHRGLWNNTTRW
jgi:hypothetical protein